MIGRRCFVATIVALLCCGIAVAQQVNPAVITSVTPGGVGYVTFSNTSTGLNAQIGRWDTPYPNGLDGSPVPGLEPNGASVLTVGVDVNDGGIASFSYNYRTWDAGIWDWYDISVQTPNGSVPIMTHLGKPGDDYGTYFESSALLSPSI